MRSLQSSRWLPALFLPLFLLMAAPAGSQAPEDTKTLQTRFAELAGKLQREINTRQTDADAALRRELASIEVAGGLTEAQRDARRRRAVATHERRTSSILRKMLTSKAYRALTKDIAIQQVTKSVIYTVQPSGPVSLDVNVGDGQAKGVSLFLGEREILHQSPGSTQIDAEDGSLHNSLLRTITIVADVNPATNRTAVKYHLEGGAAPGDFLFEQVTGEGGLVCYVVHFHFFE